MTLNAHHIGPPPGAVDPLHHNGKLTELPASEAPFTTARNHA
jgi:hypothetical protein